MESNAAKVVLDDSREQLGSLIDDIYNKRIAGLESKRSVYPRTHFIASDIVPCDRYMVYSVLNWRDKKAFESGVVARLDEGNRHEKQMVSELMLMGFNVIQNQMPIEIKNRTGELVCRGKIDGLIQYGRQRFALEIKTMSPNVFNSVNSIEDFYKKPYLRKYLSQIWLYLYGNNLEYGLFMLDNLMGQWKAVPIELNYEATEGILQRLERCWEYVKKKEYPDPIPYDSTMCDDCAFAATCLRDVSSKNILDLSADEEFSTMAKRCAELKPLVKEHDAIEKGIKLKLEGVNERKIIMGDTWKVEVSMSKRKTANVPDDVKEKYMEEKDVKTVKVVQL